MESLLKCTILFPDCLENGRFPMAQAWWHQPQQEGDVEGGDPVGTENSPPTGMIQTYYSTQVHPVADGVIQCNLEL